LLKKVIGQRDHFCWIGWLSGILHPDREISRSLGRRGVQRRLPRMIEVFAGRFEIGRCRMKRKFGQCDPCLCDAGTLRELPNKRLQRFRRPFISLRRSNEPFFKQQVSLR